MLGLAVNLASSQASSLLAASGASSLLSTWVQEIGSGGVFPAYRTAHRASSVAQLLEYEQGRLQLGRIEGADRLLARLKRGDSRVLAVIASNPSWRRARETVEEAIGFLFERDLDQYRRIFGLRVPKQEAPHAVRIFGGGGSHDILLRRLELSRSEAAAAYRAFRGGNNIHMNERPRAVRQVVRDLVELEACQYMAGRRSTIATAFDREVAKNRTQLDQETASLYAWIGSLGSVCCSELEFQFGPDDLMTTAYEVLGRGRPLKLLPKEEGIRHEVERYMQWVVSMGERLFPDEFAYLWDHGRRNFLSGEQVTKTGLEDRYRFVHMLMNVRSGRPLVAQPSGRELVSVISLVRRHLQPSVSGYVQALAVLRDHMNRFTPELREAMTQAPPVIRMLAVENYFGPSRYRLVTDPTAAFNLVRFLGEVGFYRELGLTTQFHRESKEHALILGDIKGVVEEETDDIFLIHTHPSVDQEVDTVHPSLIGVEDNALFSGDDISGSIGTGRRIFQMHQEGVAFPLYLYDPSSRIYTNWLQSNYGAGIIYVQVDAGGQLAGVKIRYAYRPDNGPHFGETAPELIQALIGAYQRRYRVPVAIEQLGPDHYQEILDTMPKTV